MIDTMFEPAVPRYAYPAEDDAHRHRSGVCRYEATFRHAPVGMAHVAPDGSFIDVNEQFAAITGHSRQALLEHGFQQITHPEDLASDLEQVDLLLSGRAEHYAMEKRYLRPDGEVVWVNLTVSLMRDSRGAPDYFISVIEDLTEVMHARAEALRDPLTALLNRRGFDERLTRDRARLRRDDSLTLAYLDLDDFKSINDAFGHQHGDQCLVAAAAALSGALHPSDRIARLGGDEFAVLIARNDAGDCEATVAALDTALRTVDAAPGRPLGGSVGAITVRGDDSRSNSALLALADRAMFAEKRRRRAGR